MLGLPKKQKTPSAEENIEVIKFRIEELKRKMEFHQQENLAAFQRLIANSKSLNGANQSILMNEFSTIKMLVNLSEANLHDFDKKVQWVIEALKFIHDDTKPKQTTVTKRPSMSFRKKRRVA